MKTATVLTLLPIAILMVGLVLMYFRILPLRNNGWARIIATVALMLSVVLFGLSLFLKH
jgi:hypothetical protein